MGDKLLGANSTFHWALHIIVIVVLLYLLYVVVFSQKERDGFRQAQRQGASALVLFKATWCGHCKRFMPIWKKMPAMIENVSVITVDTDEYPQITKLQNVNSFPTIMLLPRGLFDKRGQIVYSGERTVPAIVAWTKSNLNQDGGVAAGVLDENVKSVSDTLKSLRVENFDPGQLFRPRTLPGDPPLPHRLGYERFDPGRDVYPRTLPGDPSLPRRLGVERFDPVRDIYPRTLPGDPPLPQRLGYERFDPGHAIYPKNIPNMPLIENLTAKPYFGPLTDAISVGSTTYHDQADLRWGVRPRIMTRYPPGSYYNQNIVNRGYKY